MTVEQLKEYGLKAMSEAEISQFLKNEQYGVLGLPTDGVPYLLPLSFGYDGESTLYFTYFVSDESRKRTLTRQAEKASFLVYSPDSVFFWESVVLTGSLRELPRSEWDAHEAILENTWRLNLFEKAESAGHLEVYQFHIEDKSGLKATGLPPGMEDQRSDTDSA